MRKYSLSIINDLSAYINVFTDINHIDKFVAFQKFCDSLIDHYVHSDAALRAENMRGTF